MAMRSMLGLPAILLTSAASVAGAHPHVFVDVDVLVVFDAGAPTGVQLTWRYDDYFSLLLTSDLGLDLDGDLQMTAAELATLADAVTNWPANFVGEVEVLQDGQRVRLGGVTEHSVAYKNGIVSETHTRPILPVLDTRDDLTMRVFDPNYYAAYELSGLVEIQGRDGCTAKIVPPDLEAANALVQELLSGLKATEVGPDEYFPEVGLKFAETVVVSCKG